MLQPGAYMLCVQFFGNYNGQEKALSEEICKQFSIKGTDANTYTPPQNIMPAEGKIFSETEAKQPLTFRWTPVVPKPQGDVIYKVRVLEIRKGLSATEAMKTNTPILEKEVVNQTQLFFGGVFDGPINKINSDSKLGWYVEATDKQGKSLGSSGVTVFSLGSSASQNPQLKTGGCQLDFKITSSSCAKDSSGKLFYTFCATVKDITTVSGTTMYFNDPLTFNCANGTLTGCASTSVSDLLKSPNGTVIYIGTFPNTVLKTGTGNTICFKYTPSVATATTAKFNAYALCATGSGSAAEGSGSATADTTITLPACPCVYCDQFKEWSFRPEQATATGSAPNNSVNVTATITAPVATIKSFKTELVSFVHNGKEECFGCNKDANTFGNFTGGTFGSWGNGVFPLDGTNTTHHTLSWFGANSSTIPLAGQALNLSFTAPPFNPLSCCDDEIQFCIRYSFTNAECQTCSYVKCYSVKRTHRQTNN